MGESGERERLLPELNREYAETEMLSGENRPSDHTTFGKWVGFRMMI